METPTQKPTDNPVYPTFLKLHNFSNQFLFPYRLKKSVFIVPKCVFIYTPIYWSGKGLCLVMDALLVISLPLVELRIYSTFLKLPNVSNQFSFSFEVQKNLFPLYSNVCRFVAQQIILFGLEKGSL